MGRVKREGKWRKTLQGFPSENLKMAKNEDGSRRF